MIEDENNELLMSFDISNSEILGVMDNHIHIKGDEAIFLVPREMYLKIWNMWLDAKQRYCEDRKYYCGVMGTIEVTEARPIQDITINEWSQSDEDMRKVTYKAFVVEDVGDYIDMEHGQLMREIEKIIKEELPYIIWANHHKEIKKLIVKAYNLGLTDSLENIIIDGNPHEYEVDKQSIEKLKIT